MDKEKEEKLKKSRVLEICETRDKIVPGEISISYSNHFSFMNMKEAKNILYKLKDEGFLKGTSRMGFRNTMRFEKECEICGDDFKTNNKECKTCYNCNRDIHAQDEQNIHPSLRTQKRSYRWGNLHEFD